MKDYDNEYLLKLFEDTKKAQSNFIVNRIDDHVFIKIPKAKQHFWSPQLHLEINKEQIPREPYHRELMKQFQFSRHGDFWIRYPDGI